MRKNSLKKMIAGACSIAVLCTSLIAPTIAMADDQTTETAIVTEAAVEPVSQTTVVSKAGTKVKLTGYIEGYDTTDYTITGHGFVYIKTNLLTGELTVSTKSKTKVSSAGYNANGTFTYSFKPASSTTSYTVVTYCLYKNAEGKSVYSYSEPVVFSHSQF